MQITILLAREVASKTEAKTIYELIKQKLSDHPKITISGIVSEPIRNLEEIE